MLAHFSSQSSFGCRNVSASTNTEEESLPVPDIKFPLPVHITPVAPFHWNGPRKNPLQDCLDTGVGCPEDSPSSTPMRSDDGTHVDDDLESWMDLSEFTSELSVDPYCLDCVLKEPLPDAPKTWLEVFQPLLRCKCTVNRIEDRPSPTPVRSDSLEPNDEGLDVILFDTSVLFGSREPTVPVNRNDHLITQVNEDEDTTHPPFGEVVPDLVGSFSMFLPDGDLDAFSVGGLEWMLAMHRSHVCLTAPQQYTPPIRYHFHKSLLPSESKVTLPGGGYAEPCNYGNFEDSTRFTAEVSVDSDCLECVLKEPLPSTPNTWSEVLQPLLRCKCTVNPRELCDREMNGVTFETTTECTYRTAKEWNAIAMMTATNTGRLPSESEVEQSTKIVRHFGEVYVKNVRFDDPVFLDFVYNIKNYMRLFAELKSLIVRELKDEDPWAVLHSNRDRKGMECYNSVYHAMGDDFPEYLDREMFAARFCL